MVVVEAVFNIMKWILDNDTDLTREQFKEKYKGHIHGEIPDRFRTDLKYRFDLDYTE